ncbi:STAS domain-containing protein [Micromonospora sp. NPDC049282]|uniref:STAS domain-containing protein n=1 Tax=Micromonospora sp. NPDC049282 TaxID=3364269 RepID=UPI003711A615
MTFTVTYAQRGEAGAGLRLVGELDLGTAGELNTAIDRLVAEGRRELLLDLTELTFCDSTGIAAFVRGDNLVAVDGGWLRLTGATGRVARVLQVTGLAEVLAHRRDAVDPTASASS